MGTKACLWESSSARAAPNITTPIRPADIGQARGDSWRWCGERRVCWHGSWSHSCEEWTVTATLHKQEWQQHYINSCVWSTSSPGTHSPKWRVQKPEPTSLPHCDRQWGERKAKNERKSSALELPVLLGLQEVGANVSGANSAWRFTTSVAPAGACGVLLHELCNTHAHVQTCILCSAIRVFTSNRAGIQVMAQLKGAGSQPSAEEKVVEWRVNELQQLCAAPSISRWLSCWAVGSQPALVTQGALLAKPQ